MTGDTPGTVELRLRAAVESSPSGLLMIDAAGRIVLVNREIERLFGYPREELLGNQVEILVPDRFKAVHPQYRAGFFADPRVRAMGAGRELFGRRKDGTEVPVEIGLTPVATEAGMFVISSIVDITARKEAEEARARLEEQLRRSQKLEAVGTLAGGIAHDFNNILGAIIGYAELLADEVRSEQGRADLAELLSYADRGKQLVNRILTFSRRQEPERRPISLVQAVTDAAKLLRATLPATIELRVELSPEAPRVLADTTSVHQVLMNLATNAAQAMPQGGRLEICLEPFYVRDSMARANPGLHEGLYARLLVRDNGPGIDPAIRDRVFEPFFTTKPPGHGTGLGLSIVHSLVSEHEGIVRLQTEVGQGTTVECLFPALENDTLEAAPGNPDLPRGRGERVLLVEDEPGLARAGERRLSALGYEVTVEIDPRAALARLQAGAQEFDLVITDYTMPHLDGLELAAAIREIRPHLQIILTTGYLEDLPADRLARSGPLRLLRKPVTMRTLAEEVRVALGSDS
ncbi:MAG TPA: PAS domain S-box protein [Gemmatimonadales bacterium]|jgi:PAS domain S-box-containing protein|nr:PAS domain S-box protein [Gemmatimonadales bacterium]